ncbi:unnamed protein product [Fraxinus pennsylvanica]|uniref:Uncharacterized protein n=1 Tax=Fraxinus pennsylvanica TaxID=56036 RepID=A0AAD1ZUE0_9LAMI|nr:unnamed protein product [Fraxinus pennsylvanica]
MELIKQVNFLCLGSHGNPSNSSHPAAPETSPASIQFQHQPRQDSTGPLNSHLALKKPSANTVLFPESVVKATAVAAGARIATPSDAASLIKASQSKNAVSYHAWWNFCNKILGGWQRKTLVWECGHSWSNTSLCFSIKWLTFCCWNEASSRLFWKTCSTSSIV